VDASGGAAEPFVPDPVRRKVLAVLLVTVFMSLVGVSIVNVAIPSIQEGIGASQSEIQWVLSGYALTFGVVLVAAGRAGDIYGRGAMFITGVTIFVLSSVAAGLAPDTSTLIAARFVQGLGSGLVNPQAVGMIQHYFRGAERGRAFGAFGSTVGLSVAAGPVLGGLVIQAGGAGDGWRWTFLVNVPVGILAVVLAVLWFPRPLLSRPGGAAADLDPVGAVLLGLAVLAVLLPFVQSGTSGWIWLLLPAGAGLGWLWVRWERSYQRRGRGPMVDLGIFATPSFTNGAALISLYFLGVTSVWVLVALYMQDGLGHTALESGMVGLPNALMSMIVAHWAGRNVNRYGRAVVVGGLISVLVGLALSVVVIHLQATSSVSEWWLLATLTFFGAGQGAVVSPNQTLTLEHVPVRYAGSSGGVIQTGQRVGTSVGIAVISTLAFAVLDRSGWAQAITAGFLVVALVVLVALGIAIRDLRIRRRE
jgi:EmrB/QacA subfamily drug resistance transporter